MRIEPEELCDGVTLYEGDCLDVLPHLTGIDAVVTDPPYGIDYTTNREVGGVSASWRGKEIENDGDTSARDSVIAWAKDHELPWACFGSWKMPKPTDLRGVLVWDKGPAFGMGDLSFPWKNSWEEIYVGGPGWSGHRDEGVIRGDMVVSWESKGRTHPTEKPVSLMRKIIRKLPEGCVVLDPFSGTGATAIAALRESRKCILIEKDPTYCDIIRKRVRAAAGIGSLFDPSLIGDNDG